MTSGVCEARARQAEPTEQHDEKPCAGRERNAPAHQPQRADGNGVIAFEQETQELRSSLLWFSPFDSPMNGT